VGVGDHELHALKAPGDQVSEERGPSRAVLAGEEVEPPGTSQRPSAFTPVPTTQATETIRPPPGT
jgi:hypothetical protein